MSRGLDELARGCRQAQLIGGMLVLALATYAVVVETITAQRAPFTGFAPAVPLPLLRLLLAAMAVLGLVVVNIVRAKIIAGRVAPSSPAAARPPLVQRLLTASIVTLATCEAIAIYGFVLFLLGGRRADFYGFAAFGLLGFAVYFPRRSRWEAWVQQAKVRAAADRHARRAAARARRAPAHPARRVAREHGLHQRGRRLRTPVASAPAALPRVPGRALRSARPRRRRRLHHSLRLERAARLAAQRRRRRAEARDA